MNYIVYAITAKKDTERERQLNYIKQLYKARYGIEPPELLVGPCITSELLVVKKDEVYIPIME